VDIEINGSPAIYSSVGDVLKSSDGKIWLGTWEGLSCFDYDPDRKKHYLFYDLPGELKSLISILSLAEDKNNNIWIGTRYQGLFRYNTSSDKVSAYTKKSLPRYIQDNLKTMITDTQGDLWVGSTSGGILRIQAEHLADEIPEMQLIKSNAFQSGSLNSNMIRSIYVSRDGLIWIGTIGSGINMYSPRENRFSLHRIPPSEATGERNNFIRAIYPQREDLIWLGLHNNGLYKYNPDLEQYTHMGDDYFYTVFHILPIDKNHLFLASGNGILLAKINEEDVDILNTLDFKGSEDIPGYTASFNIIRCSESVFYAAFISGIARIELNKTYEIESIFYNEFTDPSIPISNVRVLEWDSLRNVLWAGSEGYGLSEIFLDDKHFPLSIKSFQHIHGDSTSISSDYIRTLCFDRSRNLWIGTYEGLNKSIARDDSAGYIFRRWKLKEGLPNNMIQSIEEDSNGNLWIGTNGGLSKYIAADDRFFNYKISDGLQSNEFSEHTSFYSGNGKMYFGGINGFNVFDPQHIPSNPVFPTVKITGFYLRNQLVEAGQEIKNHILLDRSIDHTDSLIFRPGENDLRFDFSAMYFSNPEKIQYAYKLEGYDQDWVIADAQERYANYTNLPSGKYQFMVRSSNYANLWNDDPTSLYIQIKTPYALRWWAFMIYLVIFALGILYFTRYSIIKITTKRNLVLESEHNQRIHELDVLRTRFFINISHDLRTPLTLITGPIESILQNFKLSPELRYQIDLINRSAKRLRYLIEQMLDMRKAEKGKLNPCLSTVDIVNFIRTESEYFEFAMRSRGINYKIESSESVIEVRIDQDMMGKVLFNLLSNAIKYTKNADITIKVARILKNSKIPLPDSLKEQDLVKIEVIDRGTGMSKEKQSRIFERFYQDIENPGSGYGVGLSHSKDLIDAQNGIIEVSSNEGEGTTFTIYLPLLENAGNEVIIENSGMEVRKTIVPEIIGDSLQEILPDESHEKQCILIVEDNVDLQSYLVSTLKSRYKILQASDGEEGLTLTLKESPDLIVSDIVMPNMDGYELCAQVKTREEISHIPVILLTARADDESKYKGLDTGADDYITKPFDVEYLSLRIKNILKNREQLRELFQRNLDLKPSKIFAASADEKFLIKLMEKIDEGIPESDFTVDSLEKELSISHTHFYRKVKSLTGLSGKELLQNMRLKRATQLLLEDKFRISEIAYMTGFTDPKYFSKCFKEKYGIRPSGYLENHKERPA